MGLEEAPDLAARRLHLVRPREAVELGTSVTTVPQEQRRGYGLLEGPTQPGQSRVNRSSAQAKAFGELVRAQAAAHVQVEQGVLLGPKSRRRGPDELGELLRLDHLGRVEGVDVLELGQAETDTVVRRHAPPPAELVDREVARHSEQPRLDAARHLALAERGPSARERVLDDVGSRVPVAQDPHREVVDRPVVTLVQSRERVLVALVRPRAERFVGLVCCSAFAGHSAFRQRTQSIVSRSSGKAQAALVSEERQLGLSLAAQELEIDLDAGDPAGLGQRARLRLEALSDENPAAVRA